MPSYFCIVHMPGAPCRDIVGLTSTDDAKGRRQATDLAIQWPGYETIALYDGERLVTVLANPQLGFATTPLDLRGLAA